MKVKEFNLPTFDEWNNNDNKYVGNIGGYICDIEAFSWNVNGKSINYEFAVACNQNPLNIYSETKFRRTFKYIKGEEDKLRDWYNKTCEEFKEFWIKFIKETFLVEE